MNHRPLRSALFAAVVLALSACGASTPPTTTAPTAAPLATAVPTAAPAPTAAPEATSATASAQTPADWKRFEVAGEGFAVNLPPEWEQIDMKSSDLSKSVGDILARTGNMNGNLQSQVEAMAASGVKFYGFDVSSGGTTNGITTNINVIKQSIGAKIPLDAVEQANVQQIKNVLKVENIESTRVTLPAGEAIKLVYQPEMQVAADQKITTALTQYIVVAGTDMYVISLTAAPDKAEDYAQVFEQIGQNFEVVK